MTRPSELRDMTDDELGHRLERAPAGAVQPALPVRHRRARELRASEIDEARDRADSYGRQPSVKHAGEGDLEMADEEKTEKTTEETPVEETPVAEGLARGGDRAEATPPRPSTCGASPAEACRRSGRPLRRGARGAGRARARSRSRRRSSSGCRARAPEEDAPSAHARGGAQADLPRAEAGARARPPPGASRRRRLRRDGQDDRRQGRHDRAHPRYKKVIRRSINSMRTTRRTPRTSATSSASSRRARCRRRSTGGSPRSSRPRNDPAGIASQGGRQHGRPRAALHPRDGRPSPPLRTRGRHHRRHGQDRDAAGRREEGRGRAGRRRAHEEAVRPQRRHDDRVRRERGRDHRQRSATRAAPASSGRSRGSCARRTS